MSKLTLSMDERVVARAKEYARARGVSISEMVEAYLAAVARGEAGAGGETPTLRALRGSLRAGEAGDYKKHLDEKYG